MFINSVTGMKNAILNAKFVMIKVKHAGISNPPFVRISKSEANKILDHIDKNYFGPIGDFDGTVVRIYF